MIRKVNMLNKNDKIDDSSKLKKKEAARQIKREGKENSQV